MEQKSRPESPEEWSGLWRPGKDWKEQVLNMWILISVLVGWAAWEFKAEGSAADHNVGVIPH